MGPKECVESLDRAREQVMTDDRRIWPFDWDDMVPHFEQAIEAAILDGRKDLEAQLQMLRQAVNPDGSVTGPAAIVALAQAHYDDSQLVDKLESEYGDIRHGAKILADAAAGRQEVIEAAINDGRKSAFDDLHIWLDKQGVPRTVPCLAGVEDAPLWLTEPEELNAWYAKRCHWYNDELDKRKAQVATLTAERDHYRAHYEAALQNWKECLTRLEL